MRARPFPVLVFATVLLACAAPPGGSGDNTDAAGDAGSGASEDGGSVDTARFLGSFSGTERFNGSSGHPMRYHFERSGDVLVLRNWGSYSECRLPLSPASAQSLAFAPREGFSCTLLSHANDMPCRYPVRGTGTATFSSDYRTVDVRLRLEPDGTCPSTQPFDSTFTGTRE